MEGAVNIAGLSKAAVLAALYNAAHVQGMGAVHYKEGVMSEEEAQRELDANTHPEKYFDYLHGRVLKVSFDNEMLDTYLYNRDNGFEAAEVAIERLRADGGHYDQERYTTRREVENNRIEVFDSQTSSWVLLATAAYSAPTNDGADDNDEAPKDIGMAAGTEPSTVGVDHAEQGADTHVEGPVESVGSND